MDECVKVRKDIGKVIGKFDIGVTSIIYTVKKKYKKKKA